MQNLRVQIDGMSCGGCVRNVTAALNSVPGVKVDSVAVGAAEIAIDPTRTSPETVKQTIEKKGFSVRQLQQI